MSMKACLGLMLFHLFIVKTFADIRPTIDSLLGKKIWIEDAFAGQSFTLRKEKKNYFVEWIRHGAGVPEIRTNQCKVRLDSKYQFRFALTHPEEKNGEFMVSISNGGIIKVYHNGIRIYANRVK